ncbi:MAG: hypothetical protein ACRC28_10590 [Clostridium sp.]|uniref:hypothetical protein n=1 Tax=Clostridium sp. TaxID=1506 RepID=UPI003F304F81
MKKMVIVLGCIAVAMLAFIGCTSKGDMMFTASGLDKVHIKELVVTNDVTKKTFNITDADGISKFEDELNNIELKEAKEDGEHSGCNVPGKNKYYVEFVGENNEVVGDLIISKEGDIQINNFQAKFIREVKNEEASKSLEEIIENNINP